MAADLGLVAHAAERDADELAPHGARDRAAERGLAGARRADEAQDRALRVVLQLAHREELEDAVLDLLEVVVVLVEHLAGVRDVEVVLGADRPRQVDDPLEVGAHDVVLGGLHRDHAQAFELVLGHLAHRLRRIGVLELLAQLVDLGVARVALAELLLDRAHLLAQVEVLLVLGQLVLHLRLDLLPELEQLDLAVEDAGQPLEALAHVELGEQLLLLVQRDVQVRGDEVGDLARVLDVHRHHLQLVGQVGDHRDELGELVHHVRLHRLELRRRVADVARARARGRV